mgnify:FL=1|jgi:archaeosine synthase beta-subunit
MPPETFSDADILAARGVKNEVDPLRPYSMLVEPEFCIDGLVEDVATIFLSNRECPFRCLMCDLWKNTTDERVPVGAIPEQIRFALGQLPAAQHIKLYNSGNFFDAQAIPPQDFAAVAELVRRFRTVIVENHPKLCTDRVVEFQQLCGTQLEVAMGLETSHKPTLSQLNKQMTTDDFARACDFLLSHDIRVRAFVLLRPPGTTEQEGVERAIESVRFAFSHGADCCAVIPTRVGNGIMDQLLLSGRFESPTLRSLETVVDACVAEVSAAKESRRVFADLWDVQKFSTCEHCVVARIQRLEQCNLTQQILPSVACPHCVDQVVGR